MTVNKYDLFSLSVKYYQQSGFPSVAKETQPSERPQALTFAIGGSFIKIHIFNLPEPKFDLSLLRHIMVCFCLQPSFEKCQFSTSPLRPHDLILFL